MHVLSALARLTRQLVVRLVKVALLLAFLAAIPYGLVTQIGSPLPRTLPTVDELLHTLTAQVSDTLVLNVLAVAAWILWAAFIVCVAVEVAAAIRGVPAPRLGPVAPLQALAGWLIAGLAAGAMAAAPVATAFVPAAPTASALSAHHGAQQATALPVRAEQAGTDLPRRTLSASSVHTGHITVLVGNERFTYTVVKGDNLSHIARDWLGDPDRWPEIYYLNKCRHFPKVGGTLHDPDLIYPGWVLYLPEDARPPAGLAPATPPTPASPAPAPPPPSASATPPSSPSTAPSQRPSPSASVATSAPADPDGVVAEPSASPSASTSGPASPDTGSPSSDPPAEESPDSGAGASLPGGWVSIPLAAALLAAAAMVWKRRRHRYIPKPLDAATLDDTDLRPLPPVMARLRRAVRQQAPNLLHPPQPAQPTVAEYASGDPGEFHLPPVGPSGLELAGLNNQIPAGGLGLIGPGAESAARALLVATLSSGSPADPDARGQVVIPADALTTLVGAQAVEVGPIPRLAVTGTLSEALMRIEELLIERRRLLEDYEASDLAGMRGADPYHPPMPPVLLLAEVPPPDLRARLTTTLHLGTPLQISAVLLGEWPRGDTLTVRTNGHITGRDYQRLGVLDVPTTLQLLEVLCEAHTGESTDTAPVEASPHTQAPATTPTSTDREQPGGTAAEPAAATADPAAAEAAITPAELFDGSSTDPSDEPQSPTAAGGGQDAEEAVSRRRRRQPVRIQLLGTPTIFDRDGNPVPGLRHHARQLLVYLAVHRNGAALPQIMEAFWPTATLRRAGERLSTEVGALRGRIRRAAGDDKVQPVVNTGGRYHLNPELIDIDLWTLSDALRRAGAATEPADRIAALREAVDTHTGPLADGHDYDWLEQPREQIRRHGVRARLHLADLLAGTDPRHAADLTKAATNLDPYNENLARQAMRAFARIGDAAAIRAQLQQLRDALDEIDEEPSGETIALAAQLQRQIAGTVGRPDQDHLNGDARTGEL